MGAFYNTSEIVEIEENSDFQSNKPQKRFYIEDDINSLFESVRISAKTTGLPKALKDKHKKSMKRPMRVSPYQSPQIGISGPVNLKQALRGLTISQASEMAAMKRLSKPTGFPGGPVKRSQIAAGVEVNDKVIHQNMVEVSVVPERLSSVLVTDLVQSRNLKLKLSSLCTRSRRKLPVVDEIQSDPVEIKKKPDQKIKSREKGEFSQSSKSSVGECSSSTSFSCDSNASGVSRPHMSKDLRWEAVYNAQKKYGNLNIRNFKLIKKLGGGDIGTVYLAELIGSDCYFALKILDNELLGLKKKATRAQTEREILQLLDHPFLPTLFSQFTTDKYSCLVIEYCPGGDLHVLRQKQPNKCFSEQATRFYVAEILLALEYLHMLGVVYRDLKPENILVREDGHIMLTDFDLSLRCDPNPTLVKPMSPSVDRRKDTESSCIDPFCLQPSWQVPCFTPKMPTPKLKSDMVVQVSPLPELVVEPTGARSNSFVGTHEYLAPEIIKGDGHGSPVDWWTFGILLYELLYGRTPFKGSSKGAAEIKQHRFFEGLNWALIRCATPPEVPKTCDVRSAGRKVTSENLVFDLF
ncbi:hypothetical protein L1987_36440 [Smallanthus sonchifolius]|uniref:Uncharacterized protein n=1 Tax=Smallanthus sonchifolius TaxID=185202 RepID=A0ACB9HEU4_9ASTR|nr:hypothetical protein L1987_36440 [Smallanthus sonchifolius]